MNLSLDYISPFCRPTLLASPFIFQKTKTTPRATSEMVSLAYIKNNFGILFTCVKIIQNLLQVAVVRH